MNNNVMKLMVAGLACVAVCGTVLAAPRGGNGGRAPSRAQMHQKVPPAHNGAYNHTPSARPDAHAQHKRPVVHHREAHRPAPVVVHHTPPPPPKPVVVHTAPPPPPAPAPVVVHHECDAGVGLGALVGAVVGAVVGAAL